MVRGTVYLMAAAVLTVGAIPATAAEEESRADRAGTFATRMIERYDTDKNGSVTLEEYLTADEDRFGSADADDDGFVTADELEAARQKRGEERRQSRLEGIDTDKDGRVSLAEAEAAAVDRARKRFERMDADKDGFISMAEMSERRSRADASPRRGNRMLRRLDRDNDQRISVAEAENARRVRFTRLDADNDGVLTVAELTERLKNRRRHGRRH
jgi:Ca2+-binding EF-hand superfamily protein